MTAKGGRLNKLYPGLTAKERAILVLRALKEDREEDPGWRWTMPSEQVADFNRYIDLTRGTSYLSLYIALLEQQVDKLSVRFAWLATLGLWAIDAWTLATYICFQTKEPITESRHRKLVDKARSQMDPAREVAEVLVERFQGWSDVDLEPAADGDDEPVVTEKAWERVLREKEGEIVRLVEEGVLEGRRKARRLLVNTGAFYDWLGAPVPVFPEWGVALDVCTDQQAKEVERLRKERQRAHEALKQAPSDPVFHSLRQKSGRFEKALGETSSSGDEIAAALATTLQEGTQHHWRELRAIELVLEEMATEFDGEDLLDPRLRGILDNIREGLEGLHEDVERYVGRFDLPEPDEEMVDLMRRIVERGAEG